MPEVFDRQRLLSRCMKANAGNFIERLGLIPDNLDTSHYPTFRSTPVVHDLYVATQNKVDSLAQTRTREELHRLLGQVDSFYIDDATEYILAEYGERIWGSSKRDHLRQAKEYGTDLYPEDLYYNIDDHYQRIRIYLCCWISNRVIRKLKLSEKRDSTSSVARNDTAFNSIRRIDLSPDTDSAAEPISSYHQRSVRSDRAAEESAQQTRTRMPDPVPLSQGRIASESSTSFRAPEAPPMHQPHTTSSRVPEAASTQSRRAAGLQSNPATEPPHNGERSESEATISADFGKKTPEYKAYTTQNTEFELESTVDDDDDTYQPPSYKKRKRVASNKRNTRIGRLSKPRLESPRARNGPATSEDVFAVPTSPTTEQSTAPENRTLDQFRFTPFIEWENEDDVVVAVSSAPDGGLSDTTQPFLSDSVLGNVTSTTMLAIEQSTAPERIPESAPREFNPQNDSVSLDLTPTASEHMRAAQSRLLRIELTQLLLPECGPCIPEGKQLDRLLQLVRLFWEFDQTSLTEKLGDAFGPLQSAFEKWQTMLEKLMEFRKRTNYHGDPGKPWAAHYSSLGSKEDRRTALFAKLELSHCMASVELNDSLFTPEAFNGEMASLLHELSFKMDFSLEDMRDLMLDFNESLLAWFT